MGQYYKIVNTTKKEFLRPSEFGDFRKLMEFGMSACGTLTGLTILLANSNGRGGGDLHSENKIIGSWANDKIVIAGDYAEKHDKGEQMNKKENLFDRCNNGDYKDISKDVIKAMCEDSQLKSILIENEVVKREPEITVHNNKQYKTIATFESIRSGEIYKVKKSYNLLEEREELSCDCKGWIYRKECKHIKHIMESDRLMHEYSEVIKL